MPNDNEIDRAPLAVPAADGKESFDFAEGLEFLSLYRAISDASLRQAIKAMVKAFADVQSTVADARKV